MRYHSLVVDIETLPDCFDINGISQENDNENNILEKNKSLLNVKSWQYLTKSTQFMVYNTIQSHLAVKVE